MFAVFLFLRQPVFGKVPNGARLERMRASKQYHNGRFQNRSFTPALSEGYSMPAVLFNFLFRKPADSSPVGEIPYIKTNLHDLPPDRDLLVWFGHSSYFLQISGIKFLIDPVFSGNASPIPGTTRAFAGSNHYQVGDIPEVDYLLITHDHYDHLDYRTVKQLVPKIKKVITGLGVGSHLEYWGYPPGMITEMDWEETLDLRKGVKLHALPARHFSGRGFTRNNTLWLSFLLETSVQKIYLGGDSGYDSHFSEIGRRFGPIDLAILENGQYNRAWQAIHCLPDETLKAARELNARRIIPVHSAKFSLALHSWYEPLEELTRLGQQANIHLLTPRIGEPVELLDDQQVFSEWWKSYLSSAGNINKTARGVR